MPLHLVEHPLVHDALVELRNKDTAPPAFRQAAERISVLLAAEALRSVPAMPVTVTTPLGPADGRAVRGDVVVVPAGTPQSVIARLSTEINKAVNDPDVRARLTATGSEPLGGTGEQYAAYLKSEQARWAKVVKETGATLE